MLNSTLEEFRVRLVEKSTEIEDLKSAVNPISPLMDECRSDIQKNIVQLARIIKKTNSLSKDLERVTFWIGAFSKGLKTLLFEQACPFLEQRTNFYLGLLNNAQLHVCFSVIKQLKSGQLKDEFNVTVESKTGGSIFSLLSGGEQQIVNFSVGLALSDFAETQVSGGSRFMILDEPFTNLDPKNCENVISFLTEHLTKKKDTILFISNEEGLQNLVPNRIHIEKRGGISEVAK